MLPSIWLGSQRRFLRLIAFDCGDKLVGLKPSGAKSAASGRLIPTATFTVNARRVPGCRGTLPEGLGLNATTGAITGTPTKAVNGPAAQSTAKVVDSTGAMAVGERGYKHHGRAAWATGRPGP